MAIYTIAMPCVRVQNLHAHVATPMKIHFVSQCYQVPILCSLCALLPFFLPHLSEYLFGYICNATCEGTNLDTVTNVRLHVAST